MSETTKYQYVSVEVLQWGALQKTLDTYGRKGWRMVYLNPGTGMDRAAWHIVFERQKLRASTRADDE